MFNVIRIPTKFSKMIRRLSDKEKVSLLEMLINIGDGKEVICQDNQVGDLISLIYGEWMNMESRNGNKPASSLLSESLGTVCSGESEHRVEYNRVEYNRIEEKKKGVAIVENKINIDCMKFKNKYEEEELKKTLLEFLEFRKQKKCAILPASQAAFIKKLATLSKGDPVDAVKILNNSIANGWQGIFSLKDDEKEKEKKKVHAY